MANKWVYMFSEGDMTCLLYTSGCDPADHAGYRIRICAGNHTFA